MGGPRHPSRSRRLERGPKMVRGQTVRGLGVCVGLGPGRLMGIVHAKRGELDGDRTIVESLGESRGQLSRT